MSRNKAQERHVFSMMIDIVVAPTFSGNFVDLYTHMNPLTAGAAEVSATSTEMVFADGAGHSYTVTGTGLVWGLNAQGQPAITGGSAYALSYSEGTTQVVNFSVLQTTGAALWAAFVAEQTGTNPAALTNLLAHHCWTYHGTDQNDVFTQTVLPDRGLLNTPGTDVINLAGGNDNWYTGTNNDTIYGGGGNDTMDGGADNDRIMGGLGNDVSYGGTGDDYLLDSYGRDSLFGGAGNDTLIGGAGNDLLVGGANDDSLSGGLGRDVFEFAAGSGHDTISGFEDTIDHLRITSGLPYQIINQGADTLIQFGTNQVLVLGVDASHFSSADFL